MPANESYEELVNAFTILADECQLLSDRKTILEHKLRYAHSEYQSLADKYAPNDPDTAKILAQLHLPSEVHVATPDRAGFVPLPLRNHTRSKQEIAVLIRDGRKAVQKLAGLGLRSSGSTASISGSSIMRYSARPTSLSTVLEQDFTIPGRKSSLLCPFAPRDTSKDPKMIPLNVKEGSSGDSQPLTPRDPTPHQSSDPICAAMYTETLNSSPPSVAASAAQCPIRFLDQHSPEEVAQYFETHKHEIPRSHEVCVKRYQRNEQDIRKLDAKYGNLVSMIQGLGEKHQPMLPSKDEIDDRDIDMMSDERVKDWAKAVSSNGIGPEQGENPAEDDDRESRFDRPLKEVRVGESPSRPWGISVPILNPPAEHRAVSPPPVPVSAGLLPKPVGKCPFGMDRDSKLPIENSPETPKPAGKCPFGHGQKAEAETPKAPEPDTFAQPTFIQSPDAAKLSTTVPQMIFHGPVFIGYPLDQAMALMQQWKGTQ